MKKQHYHSEIFSRNYPTLSSSQQEKIRHAKIAIVGLGGLGGSAFEALVRMGFENFIVIDCDKFEITNLNRQKLSTLNMIGMKKTDVAKKFATLINPNCKIKAIYGKIEGKNSILAAKWADIVLDCLDNPYSRVALHTACEKAGKPCVFGSASGAYGMASMFKKSNFKKVFSRLFPLGMELQEPCAAEGWKCASVIATAPNMIGILQAQLALNCLLGKNTVRAPEFVIFDGFSHPFFKISKI